jgi:hypothetical protein
MMTTRQDVYKAIDSERAFRDKFVGTNPTHQDPNRPSHTTGEYLVMLTVYLREAQEAWLRNPGDLEALRSIRKIAGISVHCMEDHGAPKREMPYLVMED